MKRRPMIFFALGAFLAILPVAARMADGPAAPAPQGPRPPITALAISPDQKQVVTGSQAGLGILTLPALAPVRMIPTRLANIHDLAFSPDGQWLLAVGGSPGKSGGYELFTWPGGQPRLHAEPHSDLIYAADWRADSKGFITAGADKLAMLHEIEGGDPPRIRLQRTFEGHSRPLLAVKLAMDGAQAITGSADESIRLWDLKTGGETGNLTNHTRSVTGLAIRPSTDAAVPFMLASISEDRTVRLWQTSIGRMVRFARLPVEPRALAWSDDGARILVACKDGMLRTIDAETAQILSERPALPGIAHSLALSKDGTAIIAGASGEIRRLPPAGPEAKSK